jgi:hypothetical protein
VSCDRYILVGLEADTDATAAVPDNALRIVTSHATVVLSRSSEMRVQPKTCSNHSADTTDCCREPATPGSAANRDGANWCTTGAPLAVCNC